MTLCTLVDPREALIDELIAFALDEPRLVVLDADVSRTSRTRRFRDAFPDRFYDLGVAEQNLFGVAAGLAAAGRLPVAVTFAVFAALRAAEPIRTSICYPRFNVKIVGGYAGLSNGKDGATHQSIEDVAIMRSFPNLVVMSPSDAIQTRTMLHAALAYEGPVYLRVEYEAAPLLHAEGSEFRIGQGYRMREGADVTLASYGVALARTLAAAQRLAGEGVQAEVLDLPTLKPLDYTLLVESARRTGCLITVEDHSIIGGLASAACECLVRAGVAVRFRALGVPDRFTESGTNDAVREHYGLSVEAIVRAAHQLAGEGR